ncbi:MAG TPA: hypothetical protein VKT78_18080 [Fimbriimonadaceae bacterium]|nr:hypothetical protein [Fimbriimonadaceae bacterium]
MRRLFILGLALVLATTAMADRGRHRGHAHFSFGLAIGGPVYYGPPAYAYPPPYYYCPPPYAYYGPPGPYFGLSIGFGGRRHFHRRHFR